MNFLIKNVVKNLWEIFVSLKFDIFTRLTQTLKTCKKRPSPKRKDDEEIEQFSEIITHDIEKSAQKNYIMVQLYIDTAAATENARGREKRKSCAFAHFVKSLFPSLN